VVLLGACLQTKHATPVHLLQHHIYKCGQFIRYSQGVGLLPLELPHQPTSAHKRRLEEPKANLRYYYYFINVAADADEEVNDGDSVMCLHVRWIERCHLFIITAGTSRS